MTPTFPHTLDETTRYCTACGHPTTTVGDGCSAARAQRAFSEGFGYALGMLAFLVQRGQDPETPEEVRKYLLLYVESIMEAMPAGTAQSLRTTLAIAQAAKADSRA